jgi:hypothetical protein
MDQEKYYILSFSLRNIVQIEDTVDNKLGIEMMKVD